MCSRDIITDADFGNQEGPGYLAYGGIDLFGFLWAWHNYTGAASYKVDWSPSAVPQYRFHVTGSYTVPDLWSAPWLERQLAWLVRLMLPDGTMPGFDDNSPGGRFFFGAMVGKGVTLGPLFRWAWRRSGYYSSGSVDQAPLLLATFDDKVPEATPAATGWPASFAMPHAGQVIFRSGWGKKDTQAMVLCEHGKAAGWTQNRWGDFIDGAAGHEHPDPGAFSLFAGGERLIIDSGYLGWDQHTLVNNPENHNILLVDGKGPQRYRLVIPETEMQAGKVVLKRPEQEGGWAPALDGMAYLTASDVSTPGAHLAEVFTRYTVNVPSTEIRRRAAFLAGRFLVIQDRAITTPSGKSASGGSHAYTFQIHGNGGGTSGGVFTADALGGTWSRAGGSVRAAVVGGAQLKRTERQAVHDPGTRKITKHSALDAVYTVREGEQVSFLALMAPEVSGVLAPVKQLAACQPGPCLSWSAGALTCRAWSGARHKVAATAGAPALLEAMAGAYCSGSGQVSGVFELPGLGKDDTLITGRFTLDSAGKASSYDLRLHRAGRTPGAPHGAVLDLPAVAGRVPSGACTYSASRTDAARWRVVTPPRATVSTAARLRSPLAHISFPTLKHGAPATFTLGAAVKVSAAGSCAGLGQSLSRTWRMASRPELSTLSLPAASAGLNELTFKPDLPGIYRLELKVSAGGVTDKAVVTLEVEGELPWPSSDGGARDAGPPDSAVVDASTPTPSGVAGGSGCAVPGEGTGAPSLPVLLLLLAAATRRRI